MKFKASSNPTIHKDQDGSFVPNVPGAYKTVADEQAWIDKDLKAAPVVSWFVDAENFEAVQELVQKAEAGVMLYFPKNGDTPSLHVDSRPYLDLTDGAVETILANHKDNPVTLFDKYLGRGMVAAKNMEVWRSKQDYDAAVAASKASDDDE